MILLEIGRHLDEEKLRDYGTTPNQLVQCPYELDVVFKEDKTKSSWWTQVRTEEKVPEPEEEVQPRAPLPYGPLFLH